MASAVELIRDLIVANTVPAPVDGTNIFAGYMPDTTTQTTVGFVYEIVSPPGAVPESTMGAAIAIDHMHLMVQVRGGPMDWHGSLQEALRIRAVIANLSGNYTSRGLTMLWAQPVNSPEDMGRDSAGRIVMAVSFDCSTQGAMS